MTESQRKNAESQRKLPDREKVIRDLLYLRSYGRSIQEPRIYEPVEAALELLREQESEEDDRK